MSVPPTAATAARVVTALLVLIAALAFIPLQGAANETEPGAPELDLRVTLEGPTSILVGEQTTYAIAASIADVQVLSFPADATVTGPDGQTVPITLEPTSEGTYAFTLYPVTEGIYTVTASVALGTTAAEETLLVAARKPTFTNTVDAKRDGAAITGSVTQESAGSYEVDLAPLQTGSLESVDYTRACTFTCAETCDFTCSVPASLADEEALLARFTTRRAYAYEQYVVIGREPWTANASVERESGVNEPVAITTDKPVEAYAIAFGTVEPIPIVGDAYRFVPSVAGTYALALKDGASAQTFPVTVIERTNVQTPRFASASGATEEYWVAYGRYETETLLRLPESPSVFDAALLADGARTPLNWTKEYVVVPQGSAGFIEVRRGIPSTPTRTVEETGYGSRVGGPGTQRFATSGRVVVIDNALESVATYVENGGSDATPRSVFYTENNVVSAIPVSDGSVSVNSPVKRGESATIRFDTRRAVVGSERETLTENATADGEGADIVEDPDATTDTIVSFYTLRGDLVLRQTFAGLSGERTFPLDLPPGQYILVAEGVSRGATSMRVFGDEPGLFFDDAQTIAGDEGATVRITHTLTNGDLERERVVQLVVNGTIPAQLLLGDADGDGRGEVTLAPGATERITLSAYLPEGRLQETVTITATSEELEASVTDTITIQVSGVAPVTDVDLATIGGTEQEPVAEIYNRAGTALPATIYLTGPLLTTQRSVLLEPGANNIALPGAGEAVTVRVQASGDTVPENNVRTRQFRLVPGALRVFVSERQHRDHTQYTVATPAFPGYRLAYVNENGDTVFANAYTEDDRTVWDLGALSANTEFTATLIPGTPEEAALRVVIDNNNPLVARSGVWAEGTTIPGYVGFDYLIDLNVEKSGSITYTPRLERNNYEVRAYTPGDPSLASDATVTINGVRGRASFTVNQQQAGWQFLGLHELDSTSTVVLSNRDTTQFVVADAVSFLPISQQGTIERIGNSTLDLATETGRTLRIGTTEFLESIETIESPPELLIERQEATLLVTGAEEGNYTLVVRDTERTLTIRLVITKPSFPEPEPTGPVIAGEPVQWRVRVPVERLTDTSVPFITTALGAAVRALDENGTVIEAIPVENLTLESAIDGASVTADVALLENAYAETVREETLLTRESAGARRLGKDERQTISERASRLAEARAERAAALERAQRPRVAERFEEIREGRDPRVRESVGERTRARTAGNEDAVVERAAPAALRGPDLALARVTSLPSETVYVELEFETEAPAVLVEERGRNAKSVSVSATTHYTNITTRVPIEPSPATGIVLYRTTDGIRERVTAPTLHDEDGDGLVEAVSWTVPHLSEQTYELYLRVLNPLEYLRDGETWVVYFETAGTGNLSITSPNANWTEIGKDDNLTVDEMTFLNIRCGEQFLQHDVVFRNSGGESLAYGDQDGNASFRFDEILIPDFTCDAPNASISTYMNIAGYAVLNFTFSDAIMSVSDIAVDPIAVVGVEFTTLSTATVNNKTIWENFDANATITCSGTGGSCENVTAYLLSESTASSWYDFSSPYRRQYVATSTGSSTPTSDYQVLLELDASNAPLWFDWSNVCADIRFSDFDAQEPLDHWTQDCDETTQTANIWVQMNEPVTTTGTTFWMYYGNSSQTDASNVSNTFIQDYVYLQVSDCSYDGGSGTGDCNYPASNADLDIIRSSTGVAPFYEFYGDGLVTQVDYDFNPFSGDEFYFLRFRWLFVPDTTGTYTFLSNSDDASEFYMAPYDAYGPGYNATDEQGAYDVIAYWYGGHAPAGGTCGTGGTTGSRDLTAGQGYWSDYAMNEWGGQDLARLCIDPPGAAGYSTASTTNFPGQFYARRYMTPEPTVTRGTQQVLGTIVGTTATPFDTSDANPVSCTLNLTQNCTVSWTLNATGAPQSTYDLRVLVVSNNTALYHNATQDAQILITGAFPLVWDEESVDRTGSIGAGNITQIVNLSATNLTHTNVQVSCVSGNCSLISDNFTDGSSILLSTPASVQFTCQNSSLGTISAVFEAVSTQSVAPSSITVSCVFVESMALIRVYDTQGTATRSDDELVTSRRLPALTPNGSIHDFGDLGITLDNETTYLVTVTLQTSSTTGVSADYHGKTIILADTPFSKTGTASSSEEYVIETGYLATDGGNNADIFVASDKDASLTTDGSVFEVGHIRGDPDIAVGTDNGATEIQWLENDGTPFTGAWARTNLYAGGNDVRVIYIVDLDRDGDMDIIAGDIDNDIRGCRNDGGGSFTCNWDIEDEAGADIYGLAAGDFDNDGDIDVAYSNFNGDDIYVIENDGNPWQNNWAQTAVATGVGGSVNRIDVADMDRDGFLDILWTEDTGQTDIHWGRNDQTPFNGGWTSVLISDVGNAANSISHGDFDKDGWIDVVMGDDGNDIGVAQNDGTPLGGGWTFNNLDGNVGGQVWDIVVGDIDGDTVPDIVFSNFAGDDIGWIQMDSTPFSGGIAENFIATGVGDTIAAHDIADLDGDGDLDVVLGHYGNAIEIYENTGLTSGWSGIDAFANVGDDVFAAMAGDLDNDEFSNILDFFTSSTENMEEGVDGGEFGGWTQFTAGTEYTFGFVVTPDSDWGSGRTSTMSLIVDGDDTGHNLRLYQHNWWSVVKPLRLQWTWAVSAAGAPEYLEVDRSILNPQRVNISLQNPPFPTTPVTYQCHVRNQDTLQDADSGFTVSFYRNGTLLGTNTTNSTGWAQYTFTASTLGTLPILCNITEVPAQNIFTGPKNSESVNLVSVDEIPPIITSITTNVANGSNLTRAQTWTYSFNVSDNYYVRNGTLTHNGTGNYTNYTTTFSGTTTSAVASYSYNLSNLTAFPFRGPITVSTLEGYDVQGNRNISSQNFTFDLYGLVSVTATADPGSVGEFGENATAQCLVTDDTTGLPVANYPVSLTLNTTGPLGTFLTNGSGLVGYEVNVTAPILVECGIATNTTLYYQATNTYDNFTLTRDPFPPTWSSWSLRYASDDSIVSNGAAINKSTDVYASSYWEDNFQLGSAFVEHNGTGSFANFSVTPFPTVEDSNESWANRTFVFTDFNEFPGVGLINVTRTWGRDVGGNTNSTSPPYFFYLYSNVSAAIDIPNPNNLDPTTVDITCTVLDTITVIGVPGYAVNITSSLGGLLASGTTDANGEFSTSYLDNTFGAETISCVIGDNPSDYYYLQNSTASDDLFLGSEAAPGAYNVIVRIYDTLGDSDTSNDQLVTQQLFSQLELDGRLEDVGIIDLYDSIYDFSDFVVHVAFQPGNNFSAAGSYPGETFIVADKRFGLSDALAAEELVITTTRVPDDGGRGDDIFLSVNGTNVNYTSDAEAGEVGFIRGDLDIVIAHANSNPEVRWRTNNGTPEAGAWALGSTIDPNDGNVYHVTVGDADRDGDIDVASATDTSDLQASGNNGDGTTWTAVDVDADMTDIGLFVQWGDVDGDGDLDLLAGSDDDGGDSVGIYENDGTPFNAGGWTYRELDPTGGGNDIQARGGTFVDLDGDGDLDVVVCGGEDNSLVAYENDGTPFNNAWADTIIYSANICNRVVAADFDNDGRMDLAITQAASSSQITVLQNDIVFDGDAFDDAWTRVQAVYGTGFIDLGLDLAVADIDGDGFADLVALLDNEEDLSWYHNDGTPFTGSWTKYTIESSTGALDVQGTGEIAGGITVGDIDADGDVDVAYSNFGPAQVYYYENDGTPTSGAWTQRTIVNGEIASIYSVVLADMDRDTSGNILDFGRASTENLVDGSEEFGGWTDYDAQDRYTFSFITRPDDDWGADRNVTLTLLVAEDGLVNPGRGDERLWGGSYHPARVKFSINVNRERTWTLNDSTVVPSPQDASINPSFGTGSVDLRCQVTDVDSGRTVQYANVTFRNETSGVIGTILTNSTGWANLTIDRDAIGVFNYSCSITANATLYLSVATANRTLTVNMTDRLAPRFSAVALGVANNSVVTRNSSTWFSVNWSDNWALTNASVIHNGTGSFVNYTRTLTGIEDRLNYTLNFSNETEFPRLGPITLYQQGRDSFNLSNTTSSYALSLWTYANISSFTVNDTDPLTTDPVFLECAVVDAFNGSGTPSYTVTFASNVTGTLGTNTTNSSGGASLTTTIGIQGPHNITCSIADSPSTFTFANPARNISAVLVNVTTATLLSVRDQADAPTFTTARVYEQVRFFANYTNTTGGPVTSGLGGACTVTFNVSGGWTAPTAMTYNATSALYEYNRTFTASGFVPWNASCSAPFFQSRNASDNITVNRTFADVGVPNGTVIDRDGASGSDPDVIEVNATVPFAPSGVMVSFAANLTAPSLGPISVDLGNNTTDSNGVARIYWNPDSAVYAGNHTIWANASEADSRATAWSLVYGQLQHTFRDGVIEPPANAEQNGSVTVSTNATSLGPETRTQIATDYAITVTGNLSGPLGSIGLPLAFNGSSWNATSAIIPPGGVGVWNATVNASGAYWYPNATNRTITVYGFMNVTSNATTPATDFVYQTFTTVCGVQDQHTAAAVAGANVSFYRNGTLLGSNLTNSSGVATLGYQINVSGTWSITCNVTDQPGIYYYAGDEPSRETLVTALPFPVTPVSPANGTIVDRDSVDATDPDVVLLNVTMPSYIPDGLGIEFRANLTGPSGIGGTTNVLLGWNTTVSGNAVLWFDPAGTLYAGNWTWWGENESSVINGTRIVTVKGALATAYNGSVDPNSEYNQTDLVRIVMNATSLGVETRDELETPYGIAVETVIRNTSGTPLALPLGYASPHWNNTTSITSLFGVGNWTINTTASGAYWYPDSAERNATVYGFMNVTSNTTSPSTIFSYASTTSSCRVQDQLSGYPVAGANVTFYRNGTLIGSNLTNNTGYADMTFNVIDTGVWTITCNVTDQPSILYYRGLEPERNATLTVVPFFIGISAPVNDTRIDRDGVSGSDPDVVLLNVTVPSTIPDGVNIDFTANLTDPAALGQNNIFLGANTTQGGNAVLWFNPASSLYAGNWTWWGNTTNGAPNETRTVSVIGGLGIAYNSSAEPNNAYNQTDTASITVNVTSLGVETRDQLEAQYNAVSENRITNTTGTIDLETLTYASPYWTGSHALSNLFGVGTWNTSANASARFFYGNTTNRTFTLYGFMNVTSNTTTPTTDFVYQTFTTVCGVQDQLSTYPVSGAVVSFYRNGTLLGTNTTTAAGQATLSYSINLTGTWTITCNVTDQPGILYYRGLEPERNTSVTVLPFPITMGAPTNGTIIDRDSADATDPDVVEINATVPGYVPDGVAIEFRGNLTDPGSILPAQTNILLGTNATQSGTIRFWWNPNSTTYAGNWTVYGTATDGTTNDTRSTAVKGAYSIDYTSAVVNPNNEYNRTQTIGSAVNVTSYGPENRSALNESYALIVNNTLVNTSGNEHATTLVFNGSTWNGSQAVSVLGGVGVWTTIANATSEPYWYPNGTNRTVTIYSFMNVTQNTTSPSTIFAYQSALQTCAVRDEVDDVPVGGAVVSFYRNGTLLGTNTTNGTGDVTFTFQVNTTGVWTITCNVTDQLGIYYYRGSEPERNSTLTVLPFPIGTAAPANGTIVDRDGVSAGDPDVVELIATVPSYVPDGVTIDFTANRTTPAGPAAQNDLVLGTNATSSGAARIYWNPNSTIYAGNWTWWGVDEAGAPNETRNALVYGGLASVFRNATFDPNAEYNETDTITLESNLTSTGGPETPSDLETHYTALVNATIRNPSNATDIAQFSYTSPYWNGTFDLTVLAGVGNWSATLNTSAAFFYENATTSRDFFVYGQANATNLSLTPSTHFAYETTVAACSVVNALTAAPVSGYPVSFYRNGTLVGTSTTNSTGTAAVTFQTNLTGTYGVNCTITDNLSLFYYALETTTGTNLTVLPYPITPIDPVNDTLIDRDGASGSDPDVVFLNATVPSFVPDGVTLSFYANLTDPAGIAPPQTDVLLGTNTTQSGVAGLWWNPNSTVYAGNQTWWAIEPSASLNGTLTVIVMGNLSLAFADGNDPDANYTQNETITVAVNATSFGPENRSALNESYFAVITVNVSNSSSGSFDVTTAFNGSQWVNSSIPLLNLPGVANWTIGAGGVADHFYDPVPVTRETTVYGFMNVTDILFAGGVVYTFENASVQCTVQDQFTGYAVSGANVSVERNGTFVGSALTNGSGVATVVFTTSVPGTYDVWCNVTDQLGIYYYAGDEPGRNATLQVEPFPVTAITPANGTIVDRDGASGGADPEAIALVVSVPAWVPDGVGIEFRGNLTNPSGIVGTTEVLLGWNTTLDSNATLWWNPPSSLYAGNWTWWGTNGTSASINGTLEASVYGGLAVAFNSSADPNGAYNQTDVATLIANITSLGIESRVQLATNYSASATGVVWNTTGSNVASSMSFTDPAWNTSLALSPLFGVGTWNASANVSAEFFYPALVNRTFTLYGFMNVTQNTTSPSTIFVYDSVTTVCGVQDQLSAYPVSGAVVSFYRNGTLLGTNTTDGIGETSLTYQINNSGVWTITCNVTDQPGILYYRGLEPERNTSVTVLPFPITMGAPTNGTIIDRDSADATDPDVVEINATVPSYVPDGVTIEFRGNLTDPAGIAPPQTDVLLGSNTTSSSSIRFWWNPNSTTYAGNWTVYGTATDGVANDSRDSVVKGAYSIDYTSTTTNPNGAYNQTDIAGITANVTSYGPETRDDMNASYLVAVDNTITNTTGSPITTSLVFNGSTWNGTQTLSSLLGVGTWTSRVNASGFYWYANETNRTFTLYGFMNITQNTTSPSTIFAYASTTSACSVQDQLSTYPVSGAVVSFYRNGTLLGTNTTDGLGETSLTYQVNDTGVWTITCNVTDQPGILYYRGSEPERNSTLTVLPFPMTPTSPANETALDRDATNGAMPDETELVLEVPPSIPDGLTIEFRVNLTDPAGIAPPQTNILLGTNTTNSGEVRFTWNPNSTTYAGNYSWYGAVVNGYANGTRTALVYGQLALVFANDTAWPGENATENETVTLRFNLTSLGIENRSALATDYSAALSANATSPYDSSVVNASNATYESTPETWNETIRWLDAPFGGVGVWNLSANASAQFMFPANISGRNVTVYGYANVTNITLSPNPVDAYNTQTVACTVQNQYTGVPVAGMNVSFWQEGAPRGSALTNGSGVANISYVQPTQGLFNVTCTIEDQLDILYYAGDAPNATTVANVTPILLTPVMPVNGTRVDRDEIGFDPVSAVLNGSVLAGVPDGIVVDFWANLTNPVIAGQEELYLGNATTNSTSIVLDFNPNSTWYPGTYTWFMNSSGGVPNGTRTFVVMGSVNLSYADNETEPLLVYNDTLTALFALNATVNGVETVSELNDTYGVSVNVTLTQPSGVNTTLEALYNGSQWNASLDLQYAEPGVWNTSAFANATYFYPLEWTLRNITVYMVTELNAFDIEEYLDTAAYANDLVRFYANYTNSTNESVLGAECSIAFYDRTANMTYNGTSGFYETDQAFGVEALLIYNVTCTRPFHYVGNDVSNVTMRSYANTTLDWNLSEVANATRMVTLNLTNLQNYTENDLTAYAVVPFGMNATWQQTPTTLLNVSLGETRGTIASWYIPNLTAGASVLRNFTVNGDWNITGLFTAGLRVSGVNTTNVLGP